jgi:hypothetical protein
MGAWYRVFGTNDVQPEPAAFEEQARSLGVKVVGMFLGDDQGWFRADLFVEDTSPLLEVERFLTTEEGIRSQLNTWAAWLETAEDNPNHGPVMQHMIQTTQLFTLHRPVEGLGEEPVERLCMQLCQFLARVTAGVYQVDGLGFFAADGTLLLEE